MLRRFLCYMIFIICSLSLPSSSLPLLLPLLFSLPCLRVVLLCLLLPTTSVSCVHFNQFVVQGLSSIKPMAGVTSTAPLSHEELEIDYEALDEQSPSVAKQGLSGQKRSFDQIQVVLRGRLAWTDPCKRSRSSGTLG